MLIGAPRGHDVLAEPPGHRDAAADDRDHRTAAHPLDDRRLDVLVGVDRPSAPRRAGARTPSGLRSRRSHVQASELAVVSKPASTSVSSSSRSSLVGERLAVLGPGAAAAARGCRRARSRSAARAARRDHRVGRAVEDLHAARASARPARSCPMLSSSPTFAERRGRGGGEVLDRRAQPRTRRSRASGWPSTPKMPDMITSSVIACIRGASANGAPQRPACRSRVRSTSAIICA